MAYVQIATFYLEDVAHGNPPTGYNGVKISRDDALAKAEDAARKVIADYPDQTLAVGKAHLALATAALNRNDFPAARKQYEVLTDKSGPFADSEFSRLAESHLKNFDAYQKLPPLASLAPPEPPPAPPASMPAGLDSLPGISGTPSPTGLPDFSLPATPSSQP